MHGVGQRFAELAFEAFNLPQFVSVREQVIFSVSVIFLNWQWMSDCYGRSRSILVQMATLQDTQLSGMKLCLCLKKKSDSRCG